MTVIDFATIAGLSLPVAQVITAGFIFRTAGFRFYSWLIISGAILNGIGSLVGSVNLPDDIAIDDITESISNLIRLTGIFCTGGIILFLCGLFGALRHYARSRTTIGYR